MIGWKPAAAGPSVAGPLGAEGPGAGARAARGWGRSRERSRAEPSGAERRVGGGGGPPSTDSGRCVNFDLKKRENFTTVIYRCENVRTQPHFNLLKPVR